MARPKKWSGETTAIRVPAHLSEQLIQIAQALDTHQPGFVQNYEMRLITLDDTRYLLPPVSVTAQESELLDKMLDSLLLKCKKAKVNPMAILAEMTPHVCEVLR